MTNTRTLQYGTQTIQYTLEFAPRKTLAIIVRPDLSVIVKAPEGTDISQVEEKILARAPWILKRQRQYTLYLPDVPPRQYVSGESHRYLGRQYRLKVKQIPKDEPERVEIEPQFLWVYTHDKTSPHVRPLVEQWLRDEAQKIFSERLESCFPKFVRLALPYPKFSIRPMATSWGSCSAKGFISLNIKLIQVPKEFIDYVIIHELCHLQEHNHGSQFLKLLNRVMPDWKERKEKLDRFDFG